MSAAKAASARCRQVALTQKSHWNHCAITATLKTNKWRQVFNEFGDTVAEDGGVFAV